MRWARSSAATAPLEWNARDGRITILGLHCAVNPYAGNEVRIAIRASPVDHH